MNARKKCITVIYMLLARIYLAVSCVIAHKDLVAMDQSVKVCEVPIQSFLFCIFEFIFLQTMMNANSELIGAPLIAFATIPLVTTVVPAQLAFLVMDLSVMVGLYC